ncbi:hypothetical protein BD560DRAFT_388797 [Blakeslea trispora]|nr:hypothetical protein BD560DRAFT_388797 [Blakeslea trispora]
MPNNRSNNRPPITQLAVNEAIYYLKIYDVTRDRDPKDPYVVPEVMVQSFTSTSGHSFPEILISGRLLLERVNYLKLKQDMAEAGRELRIPPMDNSMCLYIYYVTNKEVSASQINTERLSSELHDNHTVIRMPPDLVQQQVNDLGRLFTVSFPGYYFELTPYGSLIQGLGLPNNTNQFDYLNINIEMDTPDMERLINRRKNPYEEDKGEPHAFDSIKSHMVRGSTDKLSFEKDIDSFRLQTPSLKVEFNFNKHIYTRSTRLIHKYLALDPRVTPFINTIKQFVRSRNIIDLTGSMRSYGYVIMALAYLQQLNPPVIPNLQHLFDTNIRDQCHVDSCASKKPFWDTVYLKNAKRGIATRYHDCVKYDDTQQRTFKYARLREPDGLPYWHSANKNSLGELVIDFMYYYGRVFNYKCEAVSLYAGGLAPRKQEYTEQALVIEDPFVAGINIAPKDFMLDKMCSIMTTTFSMLRKGKSFEHITRVAEFSPDPDEQRIMSNYSPIPRLSKWPSAKTIAVIDLHNIPEDKDAACLCEELVQLFTAYGGVRDVHDLDFTTKQLTVVINPSAQDIIIPSSLEFQGKTIFIAELYDS